MNTYYNKCCNIDILRFWKSISNLSLVLIIPIIAGVLIKMFVNPTNIVTYFICILSYACIYCASMWFLGMKEYEKVLFSKPIKKVVKKLFGWYYFKRNVLRLFCMRSYMPEKLYKNEIRQAGLFISIRPKERMCGLRTMWKNMH